MDRRRFLATLGVVSTTLPTQSLLARTPEFEHYLQVQQSGFDAYKEQLERDFQTYQQTVQEEFERYQARIQTVWGDQQVGSGTVLVDYSENLKTRSIIDYQNATLTIEVVEPELQEGTAPDNLGSRIRTALLDTVTATTAGVFGDDALNQSIERRLAAQTEHRETAQLENRPVVADVLTGSDKPQPRQVEIAVVNAVRAGYTSQRPARQPGMQVYSISIPLNPANISNKAEQFRPLVQKYAAQEKLQPALVLAIMHSESSFNPLARSHVPAYGLMQIVPTSAGKDASEKVYGRQRLLTPSYLYNTENNIKMGCAYLGILYYRYLVSIQNPESRLYCTISAYNTGAGNVARAFTNGRNINQAAQIINKQPPTEIYRRLVSYLPYQETRNYIKKVVPRYQAYIQDYPN